MEWYLKVVRDNYVNFKGRAQRKEYWMFTLFNFIIVFALSLVDSMFGLGGESLGLLSGLYALAVLLPAIAVSIRRLHDTEHSAWWILISLVPLIGALVLLYFYIIDGTAGTNKYGENPKGTVAPETSAKAEEMPAENTEQS